jgi:hypothetical protein
MLMIKGEIDDHMKIIHGRSCSKIVEEERKGGGNNFRCEVDTCRMSQHESPTSTDDDRYDSPKPTNMITANLGFWIAIAENRAKHTVHGEILTPKMSFTIGMSLNLVIVSSKMASRLAAFELNFSNNAYVTLALAPRASCSREWVSMALACKF